MSDLSTRVAAPTLAAERTKMCALSFIAGYVDTAVFVGLFGLFTAHVTGNFVLIGSELVHGSGEAWPKLLAFPAFVLAVAVAVKVAEALERSHKARVPTLLSIEAVLLLAAFAAAAVRRPEHATDATALAAGMIAAAAMGMQNAMMRIELASLPSTTVMTMNVTQSAIDVVTMFWRNVDPATDSPKREEARRRFSRTWPQIVAFTAGAAGGAIGYAFAGLAALLLPSVLCLVLGLLWLNPQPRRFLNLLKRRE